jgi:hypothetical protein
LAVPTYSGFRASRAAQVEHKLSQGRCAMHIESRIEPGRGFFPGSSVLKTRPALVGVTLIAAAFFCFIGVGHISGTGSERAALTQGDHGTGISRAAIEKFWTIYHGNDYAAIPEVQDQLDRAIQSDPNNPTLYALQGATHFWHVGESLRDPKADRKRFGTRHADGSQSLPKGSRPGLLHAASDWVYQ